MVELTFNNALIGTMLVMFVLCVAAVIISDIGRKK